MTIHHDKLAYGKLASTREDLSEARLEEMLKELNGDEDEKKADGNLKEKNKNLPEESIKGEDV